MQEQTLLREDNWQPSPCSEPENMFKNDKQSKQVKSSTAQCNDPPMQMQARRSLTTSVDNCPSTSIAGTYNYCTGDQSQFQSMQRVTICQDSTHLPSEPYVSFKIFEQIIYNQPQLQLAFYGIPSIQFHRQAIGVKRLKKSSYSSRQIPWKRCPKYSGLLHAR